MVELLPNDPNIKKDHYWWFVPLPIADIQVPSSIQIIQQFNCYTSVTNGDFFLTTKNHIQSLVKIVSVVNSDIFLDEFTYKTGLGIKNYV